MQLRSALTAQRLPHAYLFSGPSTAPMLAAAAVLARTINCQAAGRAPCDDPCGQCDSCHKIEHGIHPDMITLQREGAAQMIPIESVRNQVITRLGLPPHEAAIRVFLIEEAAALAGPAANAMLKTLEEPPKRTLFVLCTVAPDGLLPTIRSRCQRVRFGAAVSSPMTGEESVGDAVADARRSHLFELGNELAHPPHRADLPMRICEGKGDAVLVIHGALRALHLEAVAAARAGDPGAARLAAQRAFALLDVHHGMTVHNAQPQLAIEALLVGWRT